MTGGTDAPRGDTGRAEDDGREAAVPRRMSSAEADALIDVLEAELSEPPRSTLSVLLTPKWLGALLAALVVVAVFVGLGWWQLSRAVTPGDDGSRGTEEARPIEQVLPHPYGDLDPQAIEQRVTLTGTMIPGTADVVDQRDQQGTVGAWTIVGLRVDSPDGPGVLPGALGWSPNAQAADGVRDDVARLADAGTTLTVTARIMPYEGVEIRQTTAAAYRPTVMAAAELVNRWPDTGLPWHDDFAIVNDGLPAALADEVTTIYSPPPSTQTQVNWLNIFYALEWAVFALFTLYLWWRLGRDEYDQLHAHADQEREELELLRRVANRGAADEGRSSSGVAENGR